METRDTSFEFDLLRLEKRPDRPYTGYPGTADTQFELARVNLLPKFDIAADQAKLRSRFNSNTFNSPYKRNPPLFEDVKEGFFEREDEEESDKKSHPSASDNRSIIRYLGKSSFR